MVVIFYMQLFTAILCTNNIDGSIVGITQALGLEGYRYILLHPKYMCTGSTSHKIFGGVDYATCSCTCTTCSVSTSV